MTISVHCLEKLPGEAEFYETYWNKKAFMVKNGMPASVMNNLIEADELAGLSLEEDVRSRIVKKGPTQNDWVCDHGPFDEEVFDALGEVNWSLLVQNVEHYHLPTKNIIGPFEFSPCWLIDDVMVSYSTPGGGVGPHLDSYHVFLVQGAGKRRWKIGRAAIDNEQYVENIDFKILKDGFEGDVFEVEKGDVIYIPPKFPHKGETLEEGLTFSIGFLGPSLSELFVEYGQYIEEQDQINSRYEGRALDISSSGSEIANQEVNNFRDILKGAIDTEHFDKWLRSYFANTDDY